MSCAFPIRFYEHDGNESWSDAASCHALATSSGSVLFLMERDRQVWNHAAAVKKVAKDIELGWEPNPIKFESKGALPAAVTNLSGCLKQRSLSMLRESRSRPG